MIIFIIIALITLSILILVHEIGHFVAARLSGVWVEEFGIGLPPRIWGKRIGETIYSINWLPIGGFVRMHGEVGEKNIDKPDRAFVNKSRFIRIFIAISGVLMNFFLAFVFFTVIFWFTGIAQGVEVVGVSEGSPAHKAGIQTGDNIRAIEDKKVVYTDDFLDILAPYLGKEVHLTIERKEGALMTQKEFLVEVRESPPEGEGSLGIAFTIDELYYPKLWQRPFVYTYFGAKRTVKFSIKIVEGIVMIIGQLASGQTPKGVAGPVGVTVLIAEMARFGILPLMEFSALISVNLALLNLVPFPPLDGSRILFVVAEVFFGKKILPKIESFVHVAGMAVLLILMLLLTIQEIPKLLSAGSLSGFVDSLLAQ